MNRKRQDIELPPQADPDQAYHWTPEWEAGEREVDAELASGHFLVYASIDDLFDDMDRAASWRSRLKYAWSNRFVREYNSLPDGCKALARAAGRTLSDYLDQRSEDPSAKPPEDLRVKKVKGREGIMEVTWSFARPDGRMTFSLIRDTTTDERMVFWRRCGGHDIFKDP